MTDIERYFDEDLRKLRALTIECPSQIIIGNAREVFYKNYAVHMYDVITDGRRKHRRILDVTLSASEYFEGALPPVDDIINKDKRGLSETSHIQRDVANFLAAILGNADAGSHLLLSMRAPLDGGSELAEVLIKQRSVTLQTLTVELINEVGYITLENQDCLNSEDIRHLADFELAVDALSISGVPVGIIRGGIMSKKKYAGKRVFSSGLNLKALARGELGLIPFFVTREMGLMEKIRNGLFFDATAVNNRRDYPMAWVAVVDTFAIGGGMQLLLNMDYVIAVESAFASLPASKEGLIPGAALLRLGRFFDHNLSRKISLFGQKIVSNGGEAHLLFNENVTSSELEEKLCEVVSLLSSPSVLANRTLQNRAEEPSSAFREYMMMFAVAQAGRLASQEVINKASRYSI